MGIWEDWTSYRRFQKLPAYDRNLVFYSETHQDWHHLQPLIDVLTGTLGRTVCHITSEPRAALPPATDRQHVFRIRSTALCTWLFQTLRADVMVLTMLDLHNFHLKRSLHPVHYCYVFHSMGSTHMVDHANSYDHYETLLCAGPHHVAEIRRREELAGLPPKHLVAYGYPRLERLVAAARPPVPADPPTVLLAPTWGPESTLHVCGERLIAALLAGGVRVILRPHYQTARLAPDLVAGLVARFGGHAGFRHVDRMEESASLHESDLLISDWSAMAIEYALGLGKPVLFVDVPPRVRNPRWADLGLEPMEMRIRRELGRVLPLDALEDVPRHVAELLADAEPFRKRSEAFREQWAFNFGTSVEVGAREIARLAEAQRGRGSEGRPR
ncbi:MAG TPA: CDP-glycerol glycerophosphotransferase family protein [Methylomirabilota bacterium]|nr:CDP-glycerol glycerophosphotransferase family protein [Methylomirabilota bacterium]